MWICAPYLTTRRYGGTGLGKTHVMCAIAHFAAALQPEIEVEYLTLDAFLEQMHAAISAGQLDLFMRKYERLGLLLLDDVQFLAGRRETQGELLRLFERMQTQGRQIVLEPATEFVRGGPVGSRHIADVEIGPERRLGPRARDRTKQEYPHPFPRVLGAEFAQGLLNAGRQSPLDPAPRTSCRYSRLGIRIHGGKRKPATAL